MYKRLTFITVSTILFCFVSAAYAQNVRLVSSDTTTAKYRVDGAIGEEQEGAVAAAVEATLKFAAGEVTGDPNEKTSAKKYVLSHIDQMASFATPGRIFKRGFDSSGDNMKIGIFMIVDTGSLKTTLVEAGVVTTGAQLSKSVGKPKILVVYNQGDCTRGSESSPVCALPARIKQFNAEIAANDEKVDQIFEKALSAGCLRQTEIRASSKHSENASGRAAVSGSRSASGSVGMFHARGSSHTRVRASASFKRAESTETAMEIFQASPNCKVFINQAKSIYEDNLAIKARRNRAQTELANLRKNLMENDITTLRINEWLIRERWEIVDADAVSKAQRSLESMTSTAGMPTDAIAATALLAGADVFVVHDYKETHPGGAYQVVLTTKAYDVVTGKLLASSVQSSNKMFSAEKENAIAKAVGKIMPIVINQVLSYWSDMAASGVQTKLVFRGDFSNDMIDIIEEFLDENFADVIGKRKCEGVCEWNSEITTRKTISGTYSSPAKVRKRLLRKLRSSLRNEGMEYEIIISSPTLCILEVM